MTGNFIIDDTLRHFDARAELEAMRHEDRWYGPAFHLKLLLMAVSIALSACGGGGGGGGGTGSAADTTAATTSTGDATTGDATTVRVGSNTQFPAVTGNGGGSVGAATVAQPAVTWSGPLTISRGGTYTGNWESTSASTPAVHITTAEAVIIENANIRGRGDLITGHNVNLTVRDSHGWALNPNAAGKAPGRFLRLSNVRNAVVENNYLEGTAGMRIGYFVGDAAAGQTIKIRYNRARNIDGRCSDGAGGFTTQQNCEEGLAQFAQLTDLKGVPNVEIAWNEVVNLPEQSRPEDIISIYKANGTAASPIRIHNNYVEGAYPVNVTDSGPGTFSGGGIMLGDGDGSTLDEIPGFVDAYDNHVIATTNHGINISAGHDLHFYRNRIIISGRLADGTYIPSTYAGVGRVVDYYGQRSRGLYFNNWAQDNKWAGVRRGDDGKYYRRDESDLDRELSGCATGMCTGNQSLEPGNLDLRALEAAEYGVWKGKVQQAGVRVGPQ